MPYLPALARLRISVFHDWPYLYEGDESYEQTYLQTYVNAPRAAVVFAFDGDAVVGASTCLPLADETPNVQAPFVSAGMSVQNVFYLGESVLDQKYRGRGIGVEFFAGREAHARSWGDYRLAAFCAVQRPADHPLRPANYAPLDTFWRKRGYTSQPNLHCRMSWLDRGDAQQTEKSLMFWTKPL